MRAATLATALTGATLALANPAAPAPAAAAPRAHVTPAPFLPRGIRPGAPNLAPRQGDDLSSVFSDLSSVFSDVTSALSSIHSDLTSAITVTRPTNGGFGPPRSSASADRSSLSLAFACQKAFYSLGDTYPTPASDVRSFLVTAYPGINTEDPAQLDDSLTTYCSEFATPVTPPASLASDVANYTSATDSWASAHKSEVDSLSQRCGGTQGALMELLVVTDAGSCTTAVEALVAAFHGGSQSGSTAVVVSTTSGSAGATGTGGSSSSSAGSGTGGNNSTGSSSTGAGAASTSSSSTAGAAPRETGFVAAAAAVAVGFVGVVAAL